MTAVIPEVLERHLQAVETVGREAGLDVVAGSREAQDERADRGIPGWNARRGEPGRETAGASPYRGERIAGRFRRNLARFVAGKPLEGVINKWKG